MDDIRFGLYAHNLRSLSQPSRVAIFEEMNISDGEESNSVDNLSEDADFYESGEEFDSDIEGVSLVDSDEMSDQRSDSNIDDLRHQNCKMRY